MQDLFDTMPTQKPPVYEDAADLCAYMSAGWVAERLYELYFPHLGANDVVLEPSCGDGAFLSVIPDAVNAFGVEIDAGRAELARKASGRLVITGDVLSVALPMMPTAIIGNPPFKLSFLSKLLALAHGWLPDGGLCGLVLPAYMLQTAGTLLDLSKGWSLRADHIPRNIFPGLSRPLVFAMFERGGKVLVGFSLYQEAAEVAALAERFRALLERSGRSPWRRAVAKALADLGGEATLEQLYVHIQPRRPTGNAFWKQKVRQTVMRDCVKTAKARYALPPAASAAA